jgi:hypothetical protein
MDLFGMLARRDKRIGASMMIDWNSNYQITFKLVHPPFSNDLVSIVTTHNGEAWHLWKPVDDVIIQYWKDNWNVIQQGIENYKMLQILHPLSEEPHHV